MYAQIKNWLHLSEPIRVLSTYRMVSLIITSLFFIFDNSIQSLETRLVLVCCISVACILLNYLYFKNLDSQSKIKSLVLIETIGNTLILIPSGGVNSPYVWYSLNTLLIAAIMLDKRYVWLNLFVYLIGSTGAFIAIFQPNNFGLSSLIISKDLILSLVLITCAIQLLAWYVRKLEVKNHKLVETNQQLLFANKKIKESFEHIVDLYEAVELFTTLNNKDNLIDQVLSCTQKITKTKLALFYDLQVDNKLIIKTDSSRAINQENIKSYLLQIKEGALYSSIPSEISIDKKKFMMTAVKTNYRTYGLLAIETEICTEESYYSDLLDQLQFLSRLCSISLEKFQLEQINERLVITEEQNRIANEIHDSALQRLFSISCGIYSIIKTQEKLTKEQTNEELDMIRESINNTMKELRTAIYGLSWAKGGQSNFENDVNNYINEVRRLNNVQIKFTILGNHEILPCLQRKAFYRIICEGVSNAVHHGQAGHVEITLYVKPDITLLYIVDNGLGFEVTKVKYQEDRGLGLKNINNLVYSLRGIINLNSSLGKGTSIEISIPTQVDGIKEEVV